MVAAKTWQLVSFWKTLPACLWLLRQYALLHHPVGRQYQVHVVLRLSTHLQTKLRTFVYRQSSAIIHRQVAGVDAWQKDPHHVWFVPQQSTDKIGDLSIDNHGFCLQVCTKPNKAINCCAIFRYRFYMTVCSKNRGLITCFLWYGTPYTDLLRMQTAFLKLVWICSGPQMLILKLCIHLANVWPNKRERVWANARHSCTCIPLMYTCDKDTPVAYTFVRYLSGISFDVCSLTAYLVNIGERRTNMTEYVHSCLLQSPHCLANAHIRLCLAKHIRQVYTWLNNLHNPIDIFILYHTVTLYQEFSYYGVYNVTSNHNIDGVAQKGSIWQFDEEPNCLYAFEFIR